MTFYLKKLDILHLLTSITIFTYFLTMTIYAHECLTMDVAKSIFEGTPDKPIVVLNENITLEQAYCGQEKLNYLINKKYKDQIGYKVGFTGKELQEQFNIKSPATGIIYKHMFVENNSTISHNIGYRPYIEPDFLIIIKSSDIMNASTPLDALKHIKTIHPYVEITALRFQKGTKINGKMMIAANILANKMVMGEGIKVQSSKEFLDRIGNIDTVLVNQNNDILQNINSSSLMGNPINVLMWLIKDFNKRKIILKEDDRISLGSVGKLIPLNKKTQYTYKFLGFDKMLSLKINVN